MPIQDITKRLIYKYFLKRNKNYPYFYLKLKELRYQFICRTRDPVTKAAIQRFRKCPEKKPGSKIRKELSICRKYWNCIPLQYYRYGLYKKECDLPEKELLSFIPDFFFYNLFLPYHNKKEYIMPLLDKNKTFRLLKDLGIRQPGAAFSIIKGKIYSKNSEETDYTSLACSLKESDLSEIFLKPASGRGGRSIRIFRKSGDGLFRNEENEVLDKHYFDSHLHNEDHIAQYGIKQDPHLSEIYPHSVNTLRILTSNRQNEQKILAVLLRMGRESEKIDNFSKKGLVCRIDPDSGMAADTAVSRKFEHFSRHPDTGFVFKDISVPDWQDLKNIMHENIIKIPGAVYLGWDIAITPGGPEVLEINPDFGIDGYQMTGQGLGKIFRISNPQYYWKNLPVS